VTPTKPIELANHPTTYPDTLSEETRLLLDRSSAEWALYCLMAGEAPRAAEHLHRIRPATLAAVIQAAGELAEMAKHMMAAAP
jgi:hypothetical protein